MIRFNNDYNKPAHSEVIKAINDISDVSYPGYGLDELCEKAKARIKKYINKPEAEVHFLVGGTQTNFIVISSTLRSYQSVISADSGHISVHETGAIENTGHKVETVTGKEGKLTAAQVREVAENYKISGMKEHITEPKMVYISFPTEFGTIYSKKELEDISAVCKEYGLYFFVDGARLSYGLAAEGNDVTMEDLANLTDVFYCGGTKCGAMFGEAVVITNKELMTGFRSYMKQNGALLAKGWLLGAQFNALFENGLYFNIAEFAVKYAMKIKKAFMDKGIKAYIESPTNQQFVILTQTQMDKLSDKYAFEYEGRYDENSHIVRFCTSWANTEDEVNELVGDIEKL